MTPGQILKKARREREMTLEQMAEIFGLTRARINQYETSDQMIPAERIKEWCNNPRLPEWARTLSFQLWLATLDQTHEQLGEQMVQLGQLIADRSAA